MFGLKSDWILDPPARYYTLAIDLSDGWLDYGDITFVDVTLLRDRAGSIFPPLATDPEGIFLTRPGQLYISSEGDTLATPPIDPFVNRFNLVGAENRALPVPDKFLPDAAGTRGVRLNLALESLTVTGVRGKGNAASVHQFEISAFDGDTRDNVVFTIGDGQWIGSVVGT